MLLCHVSYFATTRNSSAVQLQLGVGWIEEVYLHEKELGIVCIQHALAVLKVLMLTE